LLPGEGRIMSEKTETKIEKRYEIIIGLVGAVGVDFDPITRSLEEKLKTIGYKTNYIRLSDQIKEFNPYLPPLKRVEIKEGPENERIISHMDAGDNIREFSGRGDAVVLLALIKLFEMRENKRPNFNTVCILKSLKHPDEVYTLRRIYGPGFFLIGIHSSREKRKKTLSKAIAESHFDSKKSQKKYEPVSIELMNRDEKGTTDFGQDVSGTFHLSDVFVSLEDEERAKKDIERFIELIFENPHITPTKDEYAMFVAYAASLKSGDLSRQVGAAISNKQGDILSTAQMMYHLPKGGYIGRILKKEIETLKEAMILTKKR
jgi:cytidine deaminase